MERKIKRLEESSYFWGVRLKDGTLLGVKKSKKQKRYRCIECGEIPNRFHTVFDEDSLKWKDTCIDCLQWKEQAEILLLWADMQR